MKAKKNAIWLGIWVVATVALGILQGFGYTIYTMPSGASVTNTLMILTAILAGYQLGVLTIRATIKVRRGAAGEVDMLAGLLRVAAIVAVIGLILAFFGQLGTVGAALGAFSGLILGWSLQAPVSGIAAWILVSLQRPFRVGDRVQFPSSGLVGDVVSINPMYTVLNQVGGAVGSEEAVGRPILIPNAMLFSQVVINYTARQDAAFTLDEVVIRVTYDTDWDEAERILLGAARETTREIIAQTGQEPYVRADMYDYGIYMRLRFLTKATDRPRISYQIIRQIFQDFQRSARVDFAIPYIYSFRKGVQASARFDEAQQPSETTNVLLSEIEIDEDKWQRFLGSEEDISQLADRIKAEGLLQPVVLSPAEGGKYQVVTGHMRIEACKRLGWRSVPAVVRD